MENGPLSPRTPLSPVGRLTAYGKLAFGHLPTGLGKPLRGFPQAPSLDDDPSLLSLHISNCRHRTKVVDAGQFRPKHVGSTLLWTLRILQLTSGREFDVLHSPFYYTPLAPRCPVTVAIHDVLPLTHPKWFPPS